jgi:pimeloyl-ACP methyl ester carboxylesterase
LPTRRGSQKLTYLLFLLLFIVLAILALRQVAEAHLRSAAVLMRLSDPNAHGFVASFAGHPFSEEPGSALTAQGPLKFRLYIPQDGARAGGIVLLHGVHHLGMDDPRLKNFSRALAGAGVEVMTPELQDLADYRVTPQTVDEIGASAVILSTRLNRPVGLIGLSFAGGLSLMAAARPEYKDKIGFVLAVGAHEDMSRVARFFVTNMVTNPDGSETKLEAHDYGMLVLAYSHMEDLFPARDVPSAREALRQWLWGEPQAMKTAETLSPAGKHEFDLLLHHHEQMRQALLNEITRHQADMDAVSPRGKLAGLKADTFLLHGASDNIVPPSETLWLARDVPKRALKRVLISQALTHVDAGNGEPFSEKWALVHFFARVLEDAAQLNAARRVH